MATMPLQRHVIKFGVFEVDLAAGEIRKSGMKQKLGAQPFQLLQALLERPEQIVTREELRERLWPGNTFVDYDLALKKAVNRVRDVLGDSAERVTGSTQVTRDGQPKTASYVRVQSRRERCAEARRCSGRSGLVASLVAGRKRCALYGDGGVRFSRALGSLDRRKSLAPSIDRRAGDRRMLR